MLISIINYNIHMEFNWFMRIYISLTVNQNIAKNVNDKEILKYES